MGKMMYQIRIKESDINCYVLGRISGILDWCTHGGDKIYGIESVVLYEDPSTYETFLLFDVGDSDEEEVSTRGCS